ncbi:MAG TPA: ParB/RepB/Spo0J family partition protein [Bacteroidia bacterium]|nr:ParB/RepB/Spo0J family partition protein [Bacteroidia bacterium]
MVGGGRSLVRVPLNRVTVCPLNPRKKVDPAGIEEMARSILAHGIIQPPVARLVPGVKESAGLYEVVFGQRRLCGLLRAREIARAEGLEEPPFEIELLVRAMDDNTVREEAWVENLQRQDVSVREEAQGFEELLQLRDPAGVAVYTVAALAQKLGKDPAHISRRLKLGGVPETLWAALEAGDLGVRQLELVGQLPTSSLREKAAAEILSPRFRVSPPLTVKETQELIRENYMISLRKVEWKLTDAELVPVEWAAEGVRALGGACSDCPHRTGRIDGLQDSLSDRTGNRGWDKNSCMLPTCYQMKKEACWNREKAAAQEAGTRVLTKEEAKKTFAQWGADDAVERSSGFVVLSSKPTYAETGHYAAEETLPTWSEMIGDKLPAVDVVLARNPRTGSVCRLLPQKVAIELAEKALAAQGKESPFANRKQEKKETAKERAECEIRREVNGRVTREVMEWVREKADVAAGLTGEQGEDLAVLFAFQATTNSSCAGEILEAMGIPVAETGDLEELEVRLVKEVREAARGGLGLWRVLAVIGAQVAMDFQTWGDTAVALGERFFEALGVPMEKIRADAEAFVAAEEKARLKAAKAKKGKAA